MKINMDRVPTTLNEAVDMIVQDMSPENVEFIKSHQPADIHFGSGMWLRNNWSLWDRETLLVQWFIQTYRIGHADDISGMIFEAVWAKVRGEAFDPLVVVKRYHDHWARYGVDPVTGQRV